MRYLLEALRLLAESSSPDSPEGTAVQLTICGRAVDDLKLFEALPLAIADSHLGQRRGTGAGLPDSRPVCVPVGGRGAFGQVLLEALACGLPILTTTHTAGPDLIEDGVQGFIVEPRRPDLLAGRIAWAGSHRDELARMGERARARAEHFTWERFRQGAAAAVRAYLEMDRAAGENQAAYAAGGDQPAPRKPGRGRFARGGRSMFVALLITAAAVALIGCLIALDGSHDVFHPLIFAGPMLAFIYCWMPMKLVQAGGLSQYFDNDQLLFVQTLNVLGVTAFVVCCLAAGVRVTQVGAAPAGASCPSRRCSAC